MRHRKLRIVFSVVCGIPCALLIALWGRSYWWTDQLSIQMSPHGQSCVSSRGLLCFSTWEQRRPNCTYDWKYEAYKTDYTEPLPPQSLFLAFRVYALPSDA